jgi:hypothetical protein
MFASLIAVSRPEQQRLPFGCVASRIAVSASYRGRKKEKRRDQRNEGLVMDWVAELIFITRNCKRSVAVFMMLCAALRKPKTRR